MLFVNEYGSFEITSGIARGRVNVISLDSANQSVYVLEQGKVADSSCYVTNFISRLRHLIEFVEKTRDFSRIKKGKSRRLC